MAKSKAPIRILIIGSGWSKSFPTIKDASEYIHISRNRIRKALDSPHGVIEGVYPQVCVDEVLDDFAMEEK